MKISELLKRKVTFSFEVFPPKMDKPLEPLLDTLTRLYAFKPDFISCTYGAGGTNKGRNLEICTAVQNSGYTEALAHFTCVGHTREDVVQCMDEYQKAGIRNVLGLRGDLPAGWEGTSGDFRHGNELIAFIKENFPAFCLGGACYMEKHLTAASMDADIEALKKKQDAGTEFLITQLCYDVSAYERFMERIRHFGVTLPVIVGLMPVLIKDAAIRMTISNGCSIPRELAEVFGRYGNDPEDFKRAGKEYTAALIGRFRSAGISGLHIYTLNRSQDVGEILKMAGLIR